MGKRIIPERVKCKWQIVGLNEQGNQSNVAIAKLVGISEECVQNTLKSLKKLRWSKILQGLVPFQS